MLPQEERREDFREMDELYSGRTLKVRWGISVGDYEEPRLRMTWEYKNGEEGNSLSPSFPSSASPPVFLTHLDTNVQHFKLSRLLKVTICLPQKKGYPSFYPST